MFDQPCAQYKTCHLLACWPPAGVLPLTSVVTSTIRSKFFYLWPSQSPSNECNALPVAGFFAGGGGFHFLFHFSCADGRCSFNIHDSSRRWFRAMDLAALPMLGAVQEGGRWICSDSSKWLRQAGLPTAAFPGCIGGSSCNFHVVQGVLCKSLGMYLHVDCVINLIYFPFAKILLKVNRATRHRSFVICFL